MDGTSGTVPSPSTEVSREPRRGLLSQTSQQAPANGPLVFLSLDPYCRQLRLFALYLQGIGRVGTSLTVPMFILK